METSSKRKKHLSRFRQIAVLLLDVCAASVALPLALWLRVGFGPSQSMIEGVMVAVPVVAAVTICAHLMLGLQPRLWRYSSISDFILTAAMAAIVALVSALVIYSSGLGQWMPRSLPAIHWLVMTVAFISLRVARRLVSEFYRGKLFPLQLNANTAKLPEFALYAGQCDRIELLLRGNEQSPQTSFKPIGVLTETDRMANSKIRGVPVLGILDDLEKIVEAAASQGKRPSRLVFAEQPEKLREAPFLQLIVRAEGLGLKLSCLPALQDGLLNYSAENGLQSINLSDLLDRRQTVLDNEMIRKTLVGRRVLVTGAAGTIGRELVRQIAAFQPAELILLDASEFGLYDVDLEIKEKYPALPRAAVLCSIRQRNQLMRVFERYRPEIVYHAAALKHVPLVEGHPCAGVQTNVLGTRNVADAASRYGAKILVQVSTDKAVNPIGLMGATKRLGELYCQALDIGGARRSNSARFLTVRFGNVLGSSGSLIPLFQRQLEAGLPLTVTHPDIERYFMTVHEAVQLVLQASARTLKVERGRIFVLDMGEPVKILDIAKRMIRLAGKVPDEEVKIEIVGLRPGEKLYEELFNEHERRLPSVLPGIFEADPVPLSLNLLNGVFDQLKALSEEGHDAAVRALVFDLLAESQKMPVPEELLILPPPVWDPANENTGQARYAL